MKITDVAVHWLRVELLDAVADSMSDLTHWDVVAVRIATSAEQVGWGYNCTIGEGSGALVSLLTDDLGPRFLGADPFVARRLWQTHYLERFATGLSGIGVQGVAAIEIAIWDLVAKICGQPLWRLLGGYNADRIPLYSTDGGWLGFEIGELVENARRIRDAGFHGFKMKVGKADLDEDYERVRAVREAVGPSYPIMVDANCRWDVATARQGLRRLAPLGLTWLEEPVHPLDVRAHAEVARASDVPLLAGESVCDLRLFRDLMVAGGIGIAQPDVLKLGGIAGWLDVAALARAFGLSVVPAGFNLMQLDAQLLAATPNALMMEHIPWIQPLFEEPLTIERGAVVVPRAPGAGTTIRAEALERYRIA